MGMTDKDTAIIRVDNACTLLRAALDLNAVDTATMVLISAALKAAERAVEREREREKGAVTG